MSAASEARQEAAADFVRRLDPGWNLGNTLDAVPDEGSWNNRPVVESTFAAVRAAGFNSVRIPVTYAGHYASEGPDFTIAPAWLDRVHDVIQMALAHDFLVITNIHHDSWQWADLTKHADDAVFDQFYKTWVQIAARLKDLPLTVAFESINEPPAENANDGARVNRFNTLFLEAINAASENGLNGRRIVNLVGGMQDPKKTVDWFVAPADISNPWAMHFHYYGPYNYIFTAWGKTCWGSAEEKKSLVDDLQMVADKFRGIPLILGEFSASPITCERSARWRYLDHLLRTTRALGMAPLMWDNGLDNFDRPAGVWRDPTSRDLILGAGRLPEQAHNSLPCGTTDDKAPTQASSAFVYQRRGEPVVEQTLPFLLNGNAILRVDGLAPDEYRVKGDKVKLSQGFLQRKFVGEPGSKGEVTVVFSAGISLPIELVLWDTPTIAITSFDASFCADELKIPIKWRGLPTLATVRMVYADNKNPKEPQEGIFDEWTKWLGPLQQGRATLEKQFKFDGANVMITPAALKTVADSGREAHLTFEFFPRVAANTVDFVLTNGKKVQGNQAQKPTEHASAAGHELSDALAEKQTSEKPGCCAVS